MKYYASKSQIDQVGYARKIGGDILAHFEKYFNISYALPKAGKKYIEQSAKCVQKVGYRESLIIVAILG